MSGNITFQSQTGDAKKEKKIPVYPGKKPPTPPLSEIQPKVSLGPEDFPQTLSLELPPNGRPSDLAKFLFTVKLPKRIRIKESLVVPGGNTTLNTEDTLLLHFIYDNPTVQATTSKGKNLRLPVNAKQKYEILPLDPRLDDMVYDGTKELMNASPLPSTVRVTEAYYSEQDDEDQVVGDIIEIEGIEHDKDRGKLLVGKCGSTKIKYSTQMCSTFTAMLYPEFHRMKELKDLQFPQRVRISNDMDGTPQRSSRRMQVLHLKKFSVDKCVVATRAADPHVYSIPVATPMKFAQDPIAIPEKQVLGMLPALYPLVNTTWGLVDPTQEVLPTSMRAIPQPLAQVLEAWLAGEKEKSKTSAEESTPKPVTKAATTSLDLPVMPLHLSSNRPRHFSEGAPRLPPRPPGGRPVSISSDPGTSHNIDSDSDSDGYETLRDPVDPLPKGVSKEIMAAVRDIINKKETELRKQRGSMTLWKTKCKTLEIEVMKLKETVASALRSGSKLSPPRGTLHDGDYGNYDDDDDDGSYHYIEPIPDDLTLPRSFAPGGQTSTAVPHSSPMTSNLREFTIAEVGYFLRQHAMEKYVETFRKNGVNGALLVEMKEAHMLDLKMSKFHALKLKIEIGKRYKPPLPV